MRFWIVKSSVHVCVDLDNEKQVDRFYKRIKKQYDWLSILHGELEMLIVIHSDFSLETAANHAVIMSKEWQQDPDWGKWDNEIDFWDKIKCLDNFFEENFSYISPVKIFPETVIPDDSDDTDKFFEQIDYHNGVGFQGIISDVVQIATGIQANPSMQSTPLPNSGTPSSLGGHGQQPPFVPILNSKTPPPKKSKKTRKKRGSIYEHDVDVILNELVDSVLRRDDVSYVFRMNDDSDDKNKVDNTLSQADVLDITATAANFAKYLKENYDKFKNAEPKNIANALTNRSNAWKNKKKTLDRMYGEKPPGLKDVCGGRVNDNAGTDESHGARAGTRQPHTLSVDGYNIDEDNRMECEDAVEQYLRACQFKMLNGEITPEQYRLDCAKMTPKSVAMWIRENVPEYKDKNLEKLTNGVKYSDKFRNKGYFLDDE